MISATSKSQPDVNVQLLDHECAVKTPNVYLHDYECAPETSERAALFFGVPDVSGYHVFSKFLGTRISQNVPIFPVSIFFWEPSAPPNS